MFASRAGTAYPDCMQYTIRRIPKAVDAALRRRAKHEGKSLNEVAVKSLADGLGIGEQRRSRRDLSGVAGTWRRDRATEVALAAQDQLDEELQILRN